MHDGPPTLDLAWLLAQLVVGSERVDEDRIVGIANSHDAEDLDHEPGRNL
jgi:hypothetical protein